jgi:molybdenum cofactor cytidylyltransferase
LQIGRGRLLDLAIAATTLPEIAATVLVLGCHAGQIRQSMWLDEVDVVENAAWELGMLSSIQAGLRRVGPHDWTLIFPCDYGLVRAETVARLCLRAALSSSNEAAIIAPACLGRSGHPILLGREAVVAALALTPEVGLDTVVHALRDRRELVEVDDPAIHFDIDTPEDAQSARRAYEGRVAASGEYGKALQR